MYVSKHNSSREKQVIILAIPNGKGWHYIRVKKLIALSRGKTSKHCFILSEQKKTLIS